MYWTMQDIADRLGVTRASVQKYRTRGDLPPESRRFGRTPVWESSVVEEWMVQRPGQGWRASR